MNEYVYLRRMRPTPPPAGRHPGEDLTLPAGTMLVLAEVAAERARQHQLWGRQDHPDGTGLPGDGPAAGLARQACDDATTGGTLTWRHILHEEVAEAFAETAPLRVRHEMLQVAAVAVSWVEAIDRRLAAGATGETAGRARPSVDETMLAVAAAIARRSTCPRLQVGAVIADQRGVIVSTGYNGAPAGTPHCEHPLDIPCETASHAESNAILSAARRGVAVGGMTLWSTDSPCRHCAAAVIQAGIVEVVYARPYRADTGVRLLQQAGVLVRKIDGGEGDDQNRG